MIEVEFATVQTNASEAIVFPVVKGGVSAALLPGFNESDVALVFSYLREAIAAAVVGREARPPEALEQRAAAIGEELKRRGVLAGQALIDEIERRLREEVRESSRLPPNRSPQSI